MAFKSSKYSLVVVGTIAGVLNGLLGAGGGIVVVWGLQRAIGNGEADAREIFANALCVMLPISAVSAIGYALMGELFVNGIGAFMIPAIVGGVLGALLLSRISTAWLKRLFALIVIYSGIMLIIK